MVRPVWNTSSTSTTTASSMPTRGQRGRADGARGLAMQVVAVHRDVEPRRSVPRRRMRGSTHGERVREPMREGKAARGNSEEDDVGCAVIALHHLVGDARDRP